MAPRSVILALICTLAACGSEAIDPPADAAQDRADAPVEAADATTPMDAPTAPCGGLCGVGTVCAEGRCVALDGGGDATSIDAPAVDITLDVAADVGGADAASTDVASTDAADCGAGRAPIDGACECAAGLTMCRSGCSNTSTDPVNCGVCSRSCRADEVCRAGSCVALADATVAPADASDVSDTPDVCTSTADPSNCCGVDCPLRINGIRLCSAGHCAFSCISGFANCDGDAANGCESAPATDPMNCGVCGNRCVSGRCVGGRCLSPCEGGCPAGMACVDAGTACAPCDAPNTVCSNTCVNTATDNRNCGACGRVCATVGGGTSAAATTACMAGRCVVTACTLASEGYADCDGDGANGCESNLNTRANCGACGRACTGDLSCLAGHVCACSNLATNMCGDRCIRPNDPANCGRCGNACTDREFCGGTPTPACVTCGTDGPDRVIRRCGDDCRNLSNDTDNCGACGVVCPSGRLCFFGACR